MPIENLEIDESAIDRAPSIEYTIEILAGDRITWRGSGQGALETVGAHAEKLAKFLAADRYRVIRKQQRFKNRELEPATLLDFDLRGGRSLLDLKK